MFNGHFYYLYEEDSFPKNLFCQYSSYKETSLFSYLNYNACIVSIKHIDNIAFVLVLFVLNSTDYYDIVFVLFCCFFCLSYSYEPNF